MKWLAAPLFAIVLLLGGCAGPDDGCVCVWEGPVEYTLSGISTTEDGAYLSAVLSWQPCCEDTTTDERVYFVAWDGSAEVAPTIPTAAEPKSLPDDGSDVVIETPAEGSELHVLQTAQDSVTAEELLVGELVENDAVTTEVLVDVSRTE